MKKKNRLNKIFSVITLVLSAIFLLSLTLLDIVPMKYYWIILAVFFILNLVNMFCSFNIKLKKKSKSGLITLSSILSIISIIGSIYLFRAIIFMNGNIGFKGYKTENYSVIVLKDSYYEELRDLRDKNVGVLSNDSNKDKMVHHLTEKIELNIKDYSDAFEIKESLYNKEIEAMLVENSYVEILKEEDEEFSNKIKVIYEFSLNYQIEDISKDVDVTKDVFTVYIAGIDTYGKISSVSRSDVNMLATINPKTKQVLLTSIPRDYYVQLHGTTGYKDKLTHAGLYGVEKSVQTLEDLLGIAINYYVRVNFSSLVKLVDALDGVDVYSEYDFNSNAGFENINGFHFSKGYNHVNGEQALAFARTRKAFHGGDRVRGQNQQALIEALIRKACSPAIITKYNSILNSLEGSFETNMSTDEITELAKFQIDKMPSWSVTSISLDGGDASEYTYSYPSQKLYVMMPKDESITAAKDTFKKIYSHEILQSSYNGEATNVKDTGSVAGKPITPVQDNNLDTNEQLENKTSEDKQDKELEQHIEGIVE